MNHIKDYLKVDNTYGVEILFIVGTDNEYIEGRTDGTETKEELEMIFRNLDRMGLIKKYNKLTHIDFIDGGTDDDGTPIVDLYFRHFDGEDDDYFTPVCTITKEFLQELGFSH